MLHKNKNCNECSFERSEQLFQDKMDSWRNCGCTNHNDYYAPDDFNCTKKMKDPEEYCPEEDYEEMAHAMAYVRYQNLNLKTIKNCEDAHNAGTMFNELELPFTGGEKDDTY